LPTELAAACEVVAANKRRRIDVGRMSFIAHDGAQVHRMFANIASFGLSGVVDRMVNESGKRLGRMSFFVAAVRAAWSYKNRRIQLRCDGEDRIDLTIQTVAIANGRFFGGAMMVAPEAEPDDGLFDVVALGDFGLGDMIKSGRRIYKGSHLAMEKVSTRRARVVEAESIDPNDVIELDIDGEAPGRLPARFELVPSALSLIVPGAS
jgi:diacylglycerol kinase family enzyme